MESSSSPSPAAPAAFSLLPALAAARRENDEALEFLDKIIAKQSGESTKTPRPPKERNSPRSSQLSLSRSSRLKKQELPPSLIGPDNFLAFAADNSEEINENLKKLRSKNPGKGGKNPSNFPIPKWFSEEKWKSLKNPIVEKFYENLGENQNNKDNSEEKRIEKDEKASNLGRSNGAGQRRSIVVSGARPSDFSQTEENPEEPIFSKHQKPTLASLAARVLLQPALNPPNLNANSFTGDLVNLSNGEAPRTSDALTIFNNTGGNNNEITGEKQKAQKTIDFAKLVKTAQIFLRPSGVKLRSGVRGRHLRSDLEVHEARWLKVRMKQKKSTVSEADRLRAREMFEMLDLDRSASLDMEELRVAMKQLGMDVTVEELRYRLEKHDKNRDSELDFEEFLQSYQRISDWEDLFRVSVIKKFRTAAAAGEGKKINNEIDEKGEEKFLASLKSHMAANKKGEFRSGSPDRLPRIPGATATRQRDSDGVAAIERDPALHYNVPLVSRSDAWRKVDLPFFLWVPAWSRMHLLNGLMTDGNSNAGTEKGGANRGEKEKKRPGTEYENADIIGSGANSTLNSPRSRRTKLHLLIDRAGQGAPHLPLHSTSNVQDLSRRDRRAEATPRESRKREKSREAEENEEGEVTEEGWRWLWKANRAAAEKLQAHAKARAKQRRDSENAGAYEVARLFEEDEKPSNHSKAKQKQQTIAQIEAANTVELMGSNDPMIKCCKNGAWEAVLLLIQSLGGQLNHLTTSLVDPAVSGARVRYVNRRDRNGSSAAHHAAWFGHVKVLEVLLYHGLDPNIQNNRRNTALHLACEKGHKRLIALLIQHGGDPLLKNWQNKSCGDCMENVPNRTGEEEKQLKAFLIECMKNHPGSEGTGGELTNYSAFPTGNSENSSSQPNDSASPAGHTGQEKSGRSSGRDSLPPINLFQFSEREFLTARGRSQFASVLAAYEMNKLNFQAGGGAAGGAGGGSGGGGENLQLRITQAVREELSRHSLQQLWEITQSELEKQKLARLKEIRLEPKSIQQLQGNFKEMAMATGEPAVGGGEEE